MLPSQPMCRRYISDTRAERDPRYDCFPMNAWPSELLQQRHAQRSDLYDEPIWRSRVFVLHKRIALVYFYAPETSILVCVANKRKRALHAFFCCSDKRDTICALHRKCFIYYHESNAETAQRIIHSAVAALPKN